MFLTYKFVLHTLKINTNRKVNVRSGTHFLKALVERIAPLIRMCIQVISNVFKSGSGGDAIGDIF